MAELYTYKTNFEPIMLPGEQAFLNTQSSSFAIECVSVGPLPEYQKDFGALTAATWDTDQEDSNLEMPTGELSQLRMRVVDDMKVRFNNLSPTRQWRTANTDFYLRQYPTDQGEDFLKELFFKMSEFFVWEKDTPRFDFYSDVATLASRVIFTGWRIRCKKLTTGIRPIKSIWVSSWPSGG